MPNVIKVGRDPKRQMQARSSMDLNTKLKTVSIMEYWRVVFDGKQDDATACFGATTDSTQAHTIPSVGDAYRSTSNYAYCSDVLPQLDPASGGKAYNVQVTYASIVPTSQATGLFNATISFGAEAVQETVYYDANNNAVVNSAGQPFSNQPTKTYYITNVNLNFSTSSFNESAAEALRGYINNAPISVKIQRLNYNRTFPAGTLLFDNFEATPVVQAGALAYWDVRETFKYLPQTTSPKDGTTVSGWTLFLVDQGYCTLSSGNLKTIYDSAGAPLNSPQYLDGSGGKSTTAHYLSFTLKPSGDFTPLFAGLS